MLYVKRAQIPIRLGEYEGTTTQTKFKRNHPSKATQREKGYMGNSSNSKNTMPSVQGEVTNCAHSQVRRSRDPDQRVQCSQAWLQRYVYNASNGTLLVLIFCLSNW